MLYITNFTSINTHHRLSSPGFIEFVIKTLNTLCYFHIIMSPDKHQIKHRRTLEAVVGLLFILVSKSKPIDSEEQAKQKASKKKPCLNSFHMIQRLEACNDMMPSQACHAPTIYESPCIHK